MRKLCKLKILISQLDTFRSPNSLIFSLNINEACFATYFSSTLNKIYVPVEKLENLSDLKILKENTSDRKSVV